MSLINLRNACLSLGLACRGVHYGLAAEPRGQANDSRGPAVVELYTSQGCSSCPPADALLGELAQMPNVIALAFHVDYWDSIGWPDHFALPNAVERQHRYIEALGLSSAFTPQMVVDGHRSFVGSDKRQVLTAIAEPLPERIPLSLEVSSGELLVSVPELRNRREYTVYVAAYLPRATTPVGRGENSGRTLQEYNIVRQFRSIGTGNGQAAVYKARLDSFPTDATRVAVLLQRERQGPITGSGTIALR